MRTIRLGRTEAQVPAVSLGTWSFGGPNEAGGTSVGWSAQSDVDSRAALRAAYEAGITHWDTADVYGDGHSERIIGQSWDDVPRQEIFLASKVGYDPGPFDHVYHPEQIRRQLDGSLERLGVDTLDLYYLHHCDFGPGDRYLDDALEVLRRAREAGKFRFLGLSDWKTSAIMRVIERVDPDVVQPYRNVTADTWRSGLADYCAAHDVGVAFFSPIRHGLLLGKYPEPVEFPEGDFRRNDPGFGDADTLKRLIANRDALAERFADRPEPVLGALLGAILADAPNATVLLGQRRPDQVRAAARAAWEMTADEAAWVRDLYAGMQVDG